MVEPPTIKDNSVKPCLQFHLWRFYFGKGGALMAFRSLPVPLKKVLKHGKRLAIVLPLWRKICLNDKEPYPFVPF